MISTSVRDRTNLTENYQCDDDDDKECAGIHVVLLRDSIEDCCGWHPLRVTSHDQRNRAARMLDARFHEEIMRIIVTLIDPRRGCLRRDECGVLAPLCLWEQGQP